MTRTLAYTNFSRRIFEDSQSIRVTVSQTLIAQAYTLLPIASATVINILSTMSFMGDSFGSLLITLIYSYMIASDINKISWRS